MKAEGYKTIAEKDLLDIAMILSEFGGTVAAIVLSGAPESQLSAMVIEILPEYSVKLVTADRFEKMKANWEKDEKKWINEKITLQNQINYWKNVNKV